MASIVPSVRRMVVPLATLLNTVSRRHAVISFLPSFLASLYLLFRSSRSTLLLSFGMHAPSTPFLPLLAPFPNADHGAHFPSLLSLSIFPVGGCHPLFFSLSSDPRLCSTPSSVILSSIINLSFLTFIIYQSLQPLQLNKVGFIENLKIYSFNLTP